MADALDRDKARRKHRRRQGRKEREKESAPSTPPAKPPIILAKHHADRPPSSSTPEGALALGSASGSMTVSSPSKPPESKPIMMLKVREDSRGSPTSSAATQSVPTLLAGESANPPSMPSYQIQRNPVQSGPIIIEGSSHNRLAAPPEMLQSVKLVDDTMHWCDHGIDVLLDQTDFFTIGILGQQGVGKSTLMSLLAGNKLEDPHKSFVFRTQNKDVKEIGAHQTAGLDMYVTSERILLLDSQPVLSSSVLDYMIHHDKKYPTEFSTAENCIEMQSLQMATFLLTVCNVVIVVLDWFSDLSLLRFLQTAEMLKPATPASSHDGTTPEDSPDYYPHLVFVMNRAGREDFSVENFNMMQDSISRMLENSKLKYKGSMSMANGCLLPGLNPKTIHSNINLFLLPDTEESNSDNDGIMSFLHEYRGHPSFEYLVKVLRNNLFSLPRSLLTHTTLSEKNWFHYAARTWEAVKKSQLLSEYNRLLT